MTATSWLSREIGSTVRELRKRKGLTIKVLGDRMDICGQHLQRLETGERQWCTRTIIAASAALACRPYILLMSPDERRRARRIFA